MYILIIIAILAGVFGVIVLDLYLQDRNKDNLANYKKTRNTIIAIMLLCIYIPFKMIVELALSSERKRRR